MRVNILTFQLIYKNTSLKNNYIKVIANRDTNKIISSLEYKSPTDLFKCEPCELKQLA